MDEIVKWLREEAIDESNKNDPQPQTIQKLREAADVIEELQKAKEWKATHRHFKGGEYMHVSKATVQTATPLTDMMFVEVYQDKDGKLWVRPTHEFFDRFKKI